MSSDVKYKVVGILFFFPLGHSDILSLRGNRNKPFNPTFSVEQYYACVRVLISAHRDLNPAHPVYLRGL